MEKFFTLTVVVLASIGLAQVVSAGPGPTGKEMQPVAPAPPPCPSWTGFEIGGFGAFVEGVADTHLDLSGEFERFHDLEVDLQNRGNRSLSTPGGEIGGFLAYNYQFAGNWVIGAEFDGGYMFLRNSAERQFLLFDPIEEETDLFAVEASFKTHYLLTLGGKVGYAFCHWLPYATGGVAWADTDISGRLAEPGEDFRFEGSRDNTHTGWFVGGGLEYMFNNSHWRLRTQYQFVDFGSTGFTRTFGDPADPFIAHRSVDLREHVVQFAIVYGF
jgi:outer membrane immunogenic protein